jgi:hypothetical protein
LASLCQSAGEGGVIGRDWSELDIPRGSEDFHFLGGGGTPFVVEEVIEGLEEGEISLGTSETL